ncbi:hypothetical protein Tco_1023571 [Tanacetum coccineum]
MDVTLVCATTSITPCGRFPARVTLSVIVDIQSSMFVSECLLIIEKKYPLRKEVLMQMLKLKLESEEDNTMALELIRFIKQLLAELEPEE